MACTHDRIKCVNCVKYCITCGVKLPADYKPGKDTPEQDKAAKTPTEGQKTAKRTSRKGAK